MTTLPPQGLGARTRRVRAPGSRTAAPSFQTCRTVETVVSCPSYPRQNCSRASDPFRVWVKALHSLGTPNRKKSQRGFGHVQKQNI